MIRKVSPRSRGRLLRESKGMILPLSLIFLLVLTLMGIAAIMTLTTTHTMFSGIKRGDQALYLAEAGVEAARRIIAQTNPNIQQVLLNNGLLPGLESAVSANLGGMTGSYVVRLVANEDPKFHGYIIHCTATVGDTQKSLEVLVEPFSRFFYFTQLEDAPGSQPTDPWEIRHVFFRDGDVLDGPVHTNGNDTEQIGFHIYGNPRFRDLASSKYPPSFLDASSSGTFDRPANWNREVRLPVGPNKIFGDEDDLDDVVSGATSKGRVIDTYDEDTLRSVPHRIHFNGSSGVRVFRLNQTLVSDPDGIPDSWDETYTETATEVAGSPFTISATFNGVLFFHGGGAIYMGGRILENGTLEDLATSVSNSSVVGRWTICSGLITTDKNPEGRNLAWAGPILIDGDIRYDGTYGGPYGQIFPILLDGDGKEYVAAGDNLLGLVTSNNITIYDRVRTRANGITIHGSLMATNQTQYGSIMAANSLVTGNNPIAGDRNINLMGGIIQYHRGVMGRFEPGRGMVSGFLKNYKYDTRLFFMAPPSFPVAVNLKTRSWKD